MGGSSKVNDQMRQDQLAAQQQRNQLMQQANQPSAGEQRFNAQAAAWDEWVKGKNYGAPPAGNLLNFDLYTPAMQANQREKYANLTGIGGAQLGIGQGGNDSIAVGMSREHNIAQQSQENAGAYEGAVKGQDEYYKTGAMPWAQLGQQRNLGLLGNASSMEQFYGGQYAQTRPQSIWPSILGGLIGAGGSIASAGVTAGRF